VILESSIVATNLMLGVSIAAANFFEIYHFRVKSGDSNGQFI
jgi:hypothetical protein